MNEIIAKASDVKVIYGNHAALNKINMSVKRGDIYALVGKNGAGKTTLLRLFTGQNEPDAGHIELFGETSKNGLNQSRHRIGAIIETPAFYPFFSAEKNLEYYRIQRGIKNPDVVSTVLKETGLYDARAKKFKNYSLGMKQRLGIALALMHDPEFLVLDEPINGLDPAGIVEIRKLMLRLNHERNLTIIISSHILSELSNMATCYGFIDNGVIIKEMTADELDTVEQSYLHVNTNDNVSAIDLIKTSLSLDASLSEDSNVIIVKTENQNDDMEKIKATSSKISKLLVSNNYDLYSMEIIKTSLEDYFIELLGGANIE